MYLYSRGSIVEGGSSPPRMQRTQPIRNSIGRGGHCARLSEHITDSGDELPPITMNLHFIELNSVMTSI